MASASSAVFELLVYHKHNALLVVGLVASHGIPNQIAALVADLHDDEGSAPKQKS
jgi:hypothetical protein